MNPLLQCCHTLDCPTSGQVGPGTSTMHSRKEQRYRWTTCGKTFATTTGTPFYRLRLAADLVTLVLTLLTHGCPTQALVAAFGLDERTVTAWLQRAGQHAQQVHQHLVQAGQVDRQHVQADDLWVKLVGRRVWQALAIAVPSRLWRGGVIRAQRDGQVIQALVAPIRLCALTLAILVCVAGLASSVTAFRQGLRQRSAIGKPGRPRLVPAPGLLLGQGLKQSAKRHVTRVTWRVGQGTQAAMAAGLAATGRGTAITTASIERLNATLRSALACLVRRGRTRARTAPLLNAGLWRVGTSYPFCW